jgi:hypothetical protein
MLPTIAGVRREGATKGGLGLRAHAAHIPPTQNHRRLQKQYATEFRDIAMAWFPEDNFFDTPGQDDVPAGTVVPR